MAKVDVPLLAHCEDTLHVLGEGGCLLVSGRSEKPEDSNVMTIGWGFMGVLWGKPMFVVAVRPSRHTRKLIDETGEFTVNVPKKGMEDVVNYVGGVSGRDVNKFKETGLDLLPGVKVKAPIILECAVHYECKVAHCMQFAQGTVRPADAERWYKTEDYHMLYFGEIVHARADSDTMSKIA